MSELAVIGRFETLDASHVCLVRGHTFVSVTCDHMAFAAPCTHAVVFHMSPGLRLSDAGYRVLMRRLMSNGFVPEDTPLRFRKVAGLVSSPVVVPKNFSGLTDVMVEDLIADLPKNGYTHVE